MTLVLRARQHKICMLPFMMEEEAPRCVAYTMTFGQLLEPACIFTCRHDDAAVGSANGGGGGACVCGAEGRGVCACV